MSNTTVRDLKRVAELSEQLDAYYKSKVKTLTTQRDGACGIINDILDKLACNEDISAAALGRMRNKVQELQQ